MFTEIWFRTLTSGGATRVAREIQKETKAVRSAHIAELAESDEWPVTLPREIVPEAVVARAKALFARPRPSASEPGAPRPSTPTDGIAS
jgi:hypothetical protein